MSEHEKTRYSDEELLEFKKIILDKLEKAKADYDLLRSTITHTSSNDIEDTSPTFKVLEEGAATLSKEESGRHWCASRTSLTVFAARRVS